MLRGLSVIAALFLTGCGSAPAEDGHASASPAMTDTFKTPDWAERAPSAADIMRLYPAEALRQAVEGIVYLNCSVTGHFVLDCVEGTETTPGYGFGPAALSVSLLYTVKKNYPGAEPGTEIRLPVRFKVE